MESLCYTILLAIIIMIVPFWAFAGKIEYFITKYPTYRSQIIYGKIVGFGNMQGAKEYYLRGMEQFSVVEYKWRNQVCKAYVLHNQEDVIGDTIILAVDEQRKMVVRAKMGKYERKRRQQDIAIIPGIIYFGISGLKALIKQKGGMMLLIFFMVIFLLSLPEYYHYMQNLWCKHYCYLEQHPEEIADVEQYEFDTQNLSTRFIVGTIILVIGLLAVIIIIDLY